MTEKPEGQLSPTAQETEAIKRLALTNDGLLLHRYLRRQVESCRATPDSGALQRHEGARIFAHDLMALMAEGIESNRGGRTDSSDTSLLASSGRVAVSGTSAGRNPGARRVSIEPGDGWDSSRDPGDDKT